MYISEIGINHKGRENRALDMLNKLVNTEIDAITFQIPKPDFYRDNKFWGGSLSNKFYKDAIDLIHENNKLVGFAIADKNMISFFDTMGADFWKTLSNCLSDDDLQNELQKTSKLTFLSTGLSNEKEILEANSKLRNIRFIHTRLSQRTEDANLRAINRLKKLTNKEVAFGLHCSNLYVLYLSTAFNPSDIFFYVKENSREKYPDDKHAIVIDKVDEVVEKLKLLEKALGKGVIEKMGDMLE